MELMISYIIDYFAEKTFIIYYLCKVIQTIPIFDFTMFIGEIVAVYADEVCLENGKPDALKVKPTIMMGSGYFDIKDKLGSLFKTASTLRTVDPK